MWSPIEGWLRRWLAWCHGAGEAWQYQFYRCAFCRAIVTHRQIATGSCRCGGNRLSPAVLSLREKAMLLLLPWAFRPRSVPSETFDATELRP